MLTSGGHLQAPGPLRGRWTHRRLSSSHGQRADPPIAKPSCVKERYLRRGAVYQSGTSVCLVCPEVYSAFSPRSRHHRRVRAIAGSRTVRP
jgi:hypothetical protein